MFQYWFRNCSVYYNMQIMEVLVNWNISCWNWETKNRMLWSYWWLLTSIKQRNKPTMVIKSYLLWIVCVCTMCGLYLASFPGHSQNLWWKKRLRSSQDLPEFILQLWRKNRQLQDKICEWPGKEASLYQLPDNLERRTDKHKWLPSVC